MLLDAPVVEHLIALVPGQRSAQPSRHRAECADQGVTDGLRRVVSRHRYQDCGSELAFDKGHDRRTLPSSDDQIAFLTVQGVVEARRVLIALLGAAGMASDRPVVSTMSVTAYWEWPPAALLVA